MKLKNAYFLLRHGESPINLRGLVSCWPEKIYSPLTRKGVRQIKEAAKKLKNERVDFIFSSDILRTKLTAKIVAKELRIKPKFDKRLREINLGIFNGRRVNEAGKFWLPEGKKISSLTYYKRRFTVTPPKGENYSQTEKRLIGFIKQVEKQYQNKNILIVSHQRPITLFEKLVYGYNLKKFSDIIMKKKEIKTGELRKL